MHYSYVSAIALAALAAGRPCDPYDDLGESPYLLNLAEHIELEAPLKAAEERNSSRNMLPTNPGIRLPLMRRAGDSKQQKPAGKQTQEPTAKPGDAPARKGVKKPTKRQPQLGAIEEEAAIGEAATAAGGAPAVVPEEEGGGEVVPVGPGEEGGDEGMEGAGGDMGEPPEVPEIPELPEPVGPEEVLEEEPPEIPEAPEAPEAPEGEESAEPELEVPSLETGEEVNVDQIGKVYHHSDRASEPKLEWMDPKVVGTDDREEGDDRTWWQKKIDDAIECKKPKYRWP